MISRQCQYTISRDYILKTTGKIKYTWLRKSSYASRNASRTTSHATAAARSAAAVACDMNLKAFHDAYIHSISSRGILGGRGILGFRV